jgi:hypothetical protein
MALNFQPYNIPDPDERRRNELQMLLQSLGSLGSGLGAYKQGQAAQSRQSMLDEFMRKEDARKQVQFDQEYGKEVEVPVPGQQTPIFRPMTAQNPLSVQGMPLVQQFQKMRIGGAKKQEQDMKFKEAESQNRLREAQSAWYERRPESGAAKDFYFVEPGTRKMYDANMQPIDMAPPGATPRMMTNPAASTEQTKRSALVRGARGSLEKARALMTPQVVAEMKGIRFTPGKVYSQLASSEAKRAFSHLKNAIANELYIKSGATANPGELEEKALMYLPAGNDSVEDVLYRFDMLGNEVSLFDSDGSADPVGGGGGPGFPGIGTPVGGGGSQSLTRTIRNKRTGETRQQTSSDGGRTWN